MKIIKSQNYIEVMDVKVIDGVEYKLFKNNEGRPCIRVFDVDAEEVVGIKRYSNEEQARSEFEKLIQKVKIYR